MTLRIKNSGSPISLGEFLLSSPCWTDHLLKEEEKSKLFKERDHIFSSASSSGPDKVDAHKNPKELTPLRSLTPRATLHPLPFGCPYLSS